MEVRQKIEKELKNWSNLSDLGTETITERKSEKKQAATLAKNPGFRMDTRYDEE